MGNLSTVLEKRQPKKVDRELLTCVENGTDKFSSEEHFTYLKTKRGSYLLLELLNFVPIFEFYLVTQSLFKVSTWTGVS